MKSKSLIFLLLYLIMAVPASWPLAAQVQISEEEWVLPTYPLEEPDKNPIFFTHEAYQGASRYIYPNALQDMISEERTEQAWKFLVLENKYIKLGVTPEIGGKLYFAEDKTNGYNFIYRNDAVKPSNIGMTGAWVSGGIEWCVLHHHRASSFMDVNYTLVENKDGSKTIWIGESEPRHRMRWTAAITMFPERSYFKAEINIHNLTPLSHSMLYWANVAAHTNEDYQVFFPPSVQVATYHSKNDFTHWPISTEMYRGHDFTKGVDISWWKNVSAAASFFAYDLKEDFMGGYDHGRESGTVHIGNHHIVKGAKVWEWGSGPRGQATEARLTENAGPYVEIMTGGYSDNQPDYSWIKPGEVKTVTHYWYPVKGIKGFKNANLNGAVNLQEEDPHSVFVGYYSTREISPARIVLKKDGKTVYEKVTGISPNEPFAENVKIEGEFRLTDLYTELLDDKTGEVMVSYQPVELEAVEKLPEVVKAPPEPKDIESVEEVFLTGKRIEQFYNPGLNPMDYYQEALYRDPNDMRSHIAVGKIFLKNGDYVGAREHFIAAIKRLTKDYTRPEDCEALYLEGLTLKYLGMYDAAIDTLYRATWDYAYYSAAYLELARISVLQGDFDRALMQINEALSTNAKNQAAISLKASILRKLGRNEEAMIDLEPVIKSDPLNFRAANESFLVEKLKGDKQHAQLVLGSLEKKMRGFEQNYLELASGYMNDGLFEDALDVLLRFSGEYPIVSYYLGYLEYRLGNEMAAEQYFEQGASLAVDYCFPFRLETITVMKKALEYNSQDARAYYYMGNILFDRQPEKAIGYWESAVGCDPELAIAHRNLGWGYSKTYGDAEKAISAYEIALELNPSEPIYYEELDRLYEISNAGIDKRYDLFEGKNDIVYKRDDAFIRQIAVLTLAGKANEALKYLEGKNFSYREGSSRVRNVLMDAYLMAGLKLMEEGKYAEALESFALAQVPEEEASGNNADNRNIQVYFYEGKVYEEMGNPKKAKEYFRIGSEQKSDVVNFTSYYRGMCFEELGDQEKAFKIFNTLVEEGTMQLQERKSGDSDFFAKFGAQQAENEKQSAAYLLIGLGEKGLDKAAEAEASLKKAVDLNNSNLYARLELESLH